MAWKLMITLLATVKVAKYHPPKFWKIGQPCPTAIHGPDRFNFPFDPEGGDRYRSAPEILSLDGYDADEDPLNPGAAREGGIQPNNTNFDLWLEAMDFPRIHTLEFPHSRSPYTFSENMMSKLFSRPPKLRNLHVAGLRTEGFMLALPGNSLRNLTWRNYQRDFRYNNCSARDLPSLERVLQHHGASLEALDVRGDETTSTPAAPMSTEEAKHLVKLALNIQRLTLNLARKPDGDGHHWPREELQVLAELPNLTDLTVNFALPSE
ncbi:hypothetical protein OQA88_9354 [Cercophora sp. LCS_1]